MTTFLLIIAALVIFALGLLAGFVLVGAVMAYDAKEKTGVWLTYNEKRDEWSMIGDLAYCYSKAKTHKKGIKRKYE